MIELLSLMSAAWDYTRGLPHSRRDPVVSKMVLDLNAYGVLSQRQIAAVMNVSPPTIGNILARNGVKPKPGQRGALDPAGIDVLLVLARTVVQRGEPDRDLMAFAVQKVADPRLVSVLTGINYSRLQRARHHVINYANPGFRPTPVQ